VRIYLFIALIVILSAPTLAEWEQSGKNPWEYNQPITDWFESTVFNALYSMIQSDNCSECIGPTGETGQEYCPCPNSELCVDIFVASTVYEESVVWPTAKKDHCVNRTTVAEGFLKCDIMSHTYFANIECPPRFICVDGQCEFLLNTSIGPAANLSFGDNGTLISAGMVTIGNITLEDLQMVEFGPDNSIGDASQLYYNSTLLLKVKNLSMQNGTSISARSFIVGNLSFENVSNVILSTDSSLEIRSADLPAMFSIRNPFDNSTLEFTLEPWSELHINLTSDMLAVSGSGFTVRVGPQLPQPPFLHFSGNLTEFLILRSRGLARYIFSSGNLSFSTPTYSEYVLGSADVVVSYQSGIHCVNLTKTSRYEYHDFIHKENTLAIFNKHQLDYTVCIRKQSEAISEQSDALLDLSKELTLSGPIVYQRRNNGNFSNVYETIDSNDASFQYPMGDELLRNPDYGLLTTSSTSFFSILEFENNRYASVWTWSPYTIDGYRASNSPTSITCDSDSLKQSSVGNRVTLYGPYTKSADLYETMIGKQKI
jgi:hypothetical protein